MWMSSSVRMKNYFRRTRAVKFHLCTLFVAAALAASLLLIAPDNAQADALDAAKAAGHVGERFDGYLGAVTSNPPADVARLVEEINAQRRAKYLAIAEKNGTSVAAVAALAAKKLVEEAPSGHYVMPKPGPWIRVR